VRSYEWDENQRLAVLSDSVQGTTRYHYDQAGRRIREEISGNVRSWQYNKLGQPTRAGEVTLTWNATGGVAALVQDGQQHRVRYDGRDLLTSVRTNEGRFEYRWDGEGRLIARSDGSRRTHFLPLAGTRDDARLLDYDESGNLELSYIYGSSLIAEVRREGALRLFLEDGTGEIRHFVDAANRVVPFRSEGRLRSAHLRAARDFFLPELNASLVDDRIIQRNLREPLSSRWQRRWSTTHTAIPESFERWSRRSPRIRQALQAVNAYSSSIADSVTIQLSWGIVVKHKDTEAQRHKKSGIFTSKRECPVCGGCICAREDRILSTVGDIYGGRYMMMYDVVAVEGGNINNTEHMRCTAYQSVFSRAPRRVLSRTGRKVVSPRRLTKAD
jgi:YD repeat-containing protein